MTNTKLYGLKIPVADEIRVWSSPVSVLLLVLDLLECLEAREFLELFEAFESE